MLPHESPKGRRIDISTPKYPNTFALVDDEDFERINQISWRAVLDRRVLYATHDGDAGRSSVMFMHRLVLNAPDGTLIDHINRDGLDNRKENLRFCSHIQNGRNRVKANGPSTSKYKGVYFSSTVQKYRAELRINGRKVYLGTFSDEVLAAQAYNDGAIKYFGEFARPNIIQSERLP
jgi:hypothetical protein